MFNTPNPMMGWQPFHFMNNGFPNNSPPFNQNMNYQNMPYNFNQFNNNSPSFNSMIPNNNIPQNLFYQNGNNFNGFILNSNQPLFLNQINSNNQPNNNIVINNVNNNGNNNANNNTNNNDNNSNNPNTINNNTENTNEIILENVNNYVLDKNRKDIFPDNSMMFNILESDNEIFIANTKMFELIKISKDDTSNIKRINSQNIIPNNLTQKAKTEGIIGIFDLNYIKYLGIITNYTKSATILNSEVYLINSIELIKISKIKEFEPNKDLKEKIKDLIKTKNFYYSNNYKLSLSLNHHTQKENNSKFLLNNLLLTSFFDNNIPEYFYSKMILGFASSKSDITFENKNISLDIIIIERYFNENVIFRNNDLIYIKQIEFISIFKNKNNNDDAKTFSFICYESGEAINSINSFVPFKITLVDELNQFQNLICIINNLNKQITPNQIKDVIAKNNANWLNKKIKEKETIFASNSKKKPFEKFDLKNNLDFFSNNTSATQFNSFWFIDINNTNFENNTFHDYMEILFWEILQKEIDYQKLDINIGKLDKNNKNIIYTKFLELLYIYFTQRAVSDDT